LADSDSSVLNVTLQISSDVGATWTVPITSATGQVGQVSPQAVAVPLCGMLARTGTIYSAPPCATGSPQMSASAVNAHQQRHRTRESGTQAPHARLRTLL
jgi:hypothetical protein